MYNTIGGCRDGKHWEEKHAWPTYYEALRYVYIISIRKKKKKHPTLGKNSKVGIPFLLSLNSKIFIIWGSVL